MYMKYTVDVTRPAPEMAEIDTIIAANNSSLSFITVSAISVASVFCIAAFSGNVDIKIASMVIFLALVVFTFTGYFADYRSRIVKKLLPIDGAQCAEMVHFLETAESPDVLRYVAEVRKMGRRFTHLEFSELQAFEDRAMAKIREAKAVEALYGEQAEKGL